MSAGYWDYPGHGYRPPANPSLVLPERRSPVLANQGSPLIGRRRPVAYSALNDADRLLFDVQLAAWRAGCALAAAGSQSTMYGVLVPHELVTEWESWRDEYEFQRQCAAERRSVERLAQRH
jgi:hypothetical protein